MAEISDEELDECANELVRDLLERRAAVDHWEGHLASSALSTGTAILALHLARLRPDGLRRGRLEPSDRGVDALIAGGAGWLAKHQNPDGGWGDTTRSRSNISTTAIVWGALSKVAGEDPSIVLSLQRAEVWLRAAAGGVSPDALRAAILRRYGKDQTFSVPILTVLALTGKLGSDATAAWRSVPQLP